MNSYRRSALCSQGPKTQESALTHFHVRLLISVVLNARHCLVSVTVILSGWGRETKHETKHACPFFAPWTFNLALLCPSCTLDLQPCTTVLFLHLGPPTLHCCVVLAPWTSNLAPVYCSCTLDLQPCTAVPFLHLGLPTLHTHTHIL